MVIAATVKKKDHPKTLLSNSAPTIIIDTKPRSPSTYCELNENISSEIFFPISFLYYSNNNNNNNNNNRVYK